MMPRVNPNVLGMSRDPNRQLRAGAERGQLWEDIVRSKSMTEQAPTRMVSGPGMVPGRMMDPGQMNFFQRQAYLPSGSAFERGGAPTPGGTSALSPHTIGAGTEGTFHLATGEPTYAAGSAGRAGAAESGVPQMSAEQMKALAQYLARYQQGG
jgi:hypothetical protein